MLHEQKHAGVHALVAEDELGHVRHGEVGAVFGEGGEDLGSRRQDRGQLGVHAVVVFEGRGKWSLFQGAGFAYTAGTS